LTLIQLPGRPTTATIRGMKGSRVLLAVFAATVVVASAAGAASIHPAGLPLSLNLPAGWSAGGASKTAVFNASGGVGHLAVTKGGSYPTGLPFALFVKTETSSATKAYKAEDAHAVVSGKKIMLPSGSAVQIKATVHHAGAPVSITLYSLLHDGVTYHFTFFTNGAASAGDKAAFATIAKSIKY
jgi:hypothetical protein